MRGPIASRVGDLPVVEPTGDQRQDVELARGDRVRQRFLARGDERSPASSSARLDPFDRDSEPGAVGASRRSRPDDDPCGAARSRSRRGRGSRARGDRPRRRRSRRCARRRAPWPKTGTARVAIVPPWGRLGERRWSQTRRNPSRHALAMRASHRQTDRCRTRTARTYGRPHRRPARRCRAPTRRGRHVGRSRSGHDGGGRVTRRQLLTGAGAAAIGGLAVGGLGGYALGSSGDDGSSGAGGATGGGGGSTETIKLGSASPTTGAYSGDGQEMMRGQELAIAEINANGGVLGRQLELVVVDVEDPFAPEKMVNAARRLSNEGVAATFSRLHHHDVGRVRRVRGVRRADVPPEHVPAQRRLRGGQRHHEHLPLLSHRGLVRTRVHPVHAAADRRRGMGAELGVGRGRHEQRPVQHLDRPDRRARTSRNSAGTSPWPSR